MIRRRCYQSAARRGIARVEVVAILGACLLVAIVAAPAVAQARVAARKLQCLSSVRTIALAIQNWASRVQGDLPPLGASLPVKNSQDQEGKLEASWAITLLPFLDEAPLLDSIKSNSVIEAGKGRLRDEDQVVIETFVCPDDVDSFKKPGGLSYVVNAGFISSSIYQGDPDRKHLVGSLSWNGTAGVENAIAIHGATGALWRGSEAFKASLDSISQGDGCSNTLLITENLQAGHWYDSDTAKIAFGIPVANAEGIVPVGAGQTFESEQKPLNTEFPEGTLTTAKFQDWRVNRNLEAKAGSLPRPSSKHPGGVNVFFCDGSGKFMATNIDPIVYLKLLTSNGISFGEGPVVPDQK